MKKFILSAVTALLLSGCSSAGVADEALERIPQEIISEQSLAVDTVSGETHTSEAILEAVADAVAQAGGDAEVLKQKAAA
ncbi:MAG: FMN-binding protein [Bulleidia sp.]